MTVLERLERDAAVSTVHPIPISLLTCLPHGQRGEHGVRAPPNLSKILFHWGLRDVLMSKASIMDKLVFTKCECKIPNWRAFPCVTTPLLARRLERNPCRTAVGRRDAERDAGAVPYACGTCCLTRIVPGGSLMYHVALIQHPDLHDIFCDAAIQLGADVRFKSEVVEVDTPGRAVTLSSGERLSGDVLIGADGALGQCRTAVLGRRDPGSATGLAVYE